MDNVNKKATTIIKEVHADSDGQPFIMIKGDFLNGLGFHDGAEFELTTKGGEIALTTLINDKATKRHKQRMLNKASNIIYNLITSAKSNTYDCRLWDCFDTLTDEIEDKVINENEPNDYQVILYDTLNHIKANVDDLRTCDIHILDMVYEEIIRGWLS